VQERTHSHIPRTKNQTTMSSFDLVSKYQTEFGEFDPNYKSTMVKSKHILVQESVQEFQMSTCDSLLGEVISSSSQNKCQEIIYDGVRKPQSQELDKDVEEFVDSTSFTFKTKCKE